MLPTMNLSAVFWGVLRVLACKRGGVRTVGICVCLSGVNGPKGLGNVLCKPSVLK